MESEGENLVRKRVGPEGTANDGEMMNEEKYDKTVNS